MYNKVYYVVKDNGDGSTAVCFFNDKELVKRLLGTDEFACNDQICYLTIPKEIVHLYELNIITSDHLYTNV